MNKLELIQALKDATDLSKSEAAAVVEILFKVRNKIFNGGLSYRAAQAPRALPCGLTRLSSICHSETYYLSHEPAVSIFVG